MFNHRLFCFVFLIFFAWTSVAEAYVDPGTGTLIWQVLAAAFFGLMFYVSSIKKWIVSKLSKRKENEH